MSNLGNAFGNCKFGRYLMTGTWIKHQPGEIHEQRWHAVDVIAIDPDTGDRTLRYADRPEVGAFTEHASFIDAIETYN